MAEFSLDVDEIKEDVEVFGGSVIEEYDCIIILNSSI